MLLSTAPACATTWTDIWDAIAAEQFSDARTGLTTLESQAVDPKAGLLLEIIGTRTNQPAPIVKPYDTWRSWTQTELRTHIEVEGVSSLISLVPDTHRLISNDLSALFDSSTSSATAKEALRISTPLLHYLRERPWIYFPRRAELLDHHIQQLILNRELDAALDALLLPCLDQESIVRLGLPAQDQPPAWRYSPNSLTHPLTTLRDVCKTHGKELEVAQRLAACKPAEAQLVRQVLLLSAGDSSEILAFARAWDQSEVVPYESLGGSSDEAALCRLLGDEADRLKADAAASLLFGLALQKSADTSDEATIKYLMGSMLRTADQAGAQSNAIDRLLRDVLCAQRPSSWQRQARRLVNTLNNKQYLVSRLNDLCPEHPFLGVQKLQELIDAGELPQAQASLQTFWPENALQILTGLDELPKIWTNDADFVAELETSNRLGKAVEEASEGELRDLASQLDDWAALVNKPDSLLPLVAQVLKSMGPNRTARHPGVTRELGRLGKAMCRATDAPEQWFPLFHFDSTILRRMGTTPLPGLNPDLNREFSLDDISKQTSLENYLTALDDTALQTLLDAVPADTDLHALVATVSGASTPPDRVRPDFAWLMAKQLLRDNRDTDLLRFLEGQTELRDAPGLLYLAEVLIDRKQVSSARFILGLGTDEQGTQDQRAHRISVTSARLTKLGLYPDAIRQARVLLGSPIDSHRKAARALILQYEKEWFDSLPPSEIKRIIDEKRQRLANHPDKIDLIEELHRMYTYQKQYRAGFDMLNSLGKAQPSNPSPLIRRAVYRTQYLNEPEEAWLDFLAAHKLEPASWLHSGQLPQIVRVALNQAVLLEHLDRIPLTENDKNRRTAALWYNVIDGSMKPFPARHPKELLPLIKTLLAFKPETHTPVRERLEEYHAMLLLQLDRKQEAITVLDRLFAREKPPAWDIRLTADGLTGLAPSYQKLTGKRPPIEHKVWTPVLDAFAMEAAGKAELARNMHLQNLAAWPNAIPDQASLLIEHLYKTSKDPKAIDQALLDQIKLNAAGHPDVLKVMCMRLIERGQGAEVLSRVDMLRYISGLTDKGRSKITLLYRDIRFFEEQKDWQDKRSPAPAKQP